MASTCLQKDTLGFLMALKDNNSKEWLDANKKWYAQSKKDFESFVEQWIAGMVDLEPEFAALVPKATTFRLNRDVRFSKDKSPYKVNFGASLTKGGKKSHLAGYYLHLQPGASFLAGGSYMPHPEGLAAIRQEIDYNGERFLSIVEEKSFKECFGTIEGEALKTTPKGYDAQHPMIHYLRFKSLTVSHSMTDEEVCSNSFLEKVIEGSRIIKPFLDFLNEALVDAPAPSWK